MPPTAENRREYNLRWKANNPDKARETHRIAQKKWRDKNREKVRARTNEWAKNNRDKVNEYRRKQHFREKYGISIEERDAILKAQNNKCACCETNDPGNKYGWVVDHNHITGQVRGILCHHCNVGLGFVNDDVEKLQKLINYLQVTNGHD